jgi:hypothetical protein
VAGLREKTTDRGRTALNLWKRGIKRENQALLFPASFAMFTRPSGETGGTVLAASSVFTAF